MRPSLYVHRSGESLWPGSLLSTDKRSAVRRGPRTLQGTTCAKVSNLILKADDDQGI